MLLGVMVWASLALIVAFIVPLACATTPPIA
jgi:hypothetical protein